MGRIPGCGKSIIGPCHPKDLIVSAGTDYHGQKDAVPGIRIEISKWKAFRDEFINASPNEILDRSPVSIKLPKSKNQWYSFVLKFVMPATLSLSLFIVALFAVFLPYFEKTLMDQKRENIRQLTQIVWGIRPEQTKR